MGTLDGLGPLRHDRAWQLCAKELDARGLEHWIERGGSHPKICWVYRGVPIKKVIPGSGSDQVHGPKKARADVRRMMRDVDQRLDQLAPVASRSSTEDQGIKPMAERTPGDAVRVVEFRGSMIDTVEVDGQPHVSLKQVVEGMGLDWEGQRQRIQRDAVLSTCAFVTKVQVGRQRRDVFVMPLRILNGFLFGIDASRVRPELRDAVIAYQRECYDALAAYWSEGAAVRGPTGPLTLDASMRAAIGGIVKSVIGKQLESLNLSHDLALDAIDRLEKAFSGGIVAPTFDLANTMTAYQAIDLAGVLLKDRQLGTSQMVTTRLLDFCSERGLVCRRTPEDLNPKRPWRFPKDAVHQWLFGESLGAEIIRNQIRRQALKKGRKVGQGALALVPASSS